MNRQIEKCVDKKEINKDTCSDCENDILILDKSRGDIICNVCGLVINENIIDQSLEYRIYNSGDISKKSRIGPPKRFVVFDEGSKISKTLKDAHGKSISPKMREKMRRLTQKELWFKKDGSKHSNLNNAINILKMLISQLRLSREILESSALIYRKILNKDLLKGRSIEAMVAASLFLTCRERNISIVVDDITEYIPVSKKRIMGSYKLILGELNAKITPSKAIHYIPRYSAEMELSEATQQFAIQLLGLAEKHNIIRGKDPTGLAAAALYLASVLEGERRTQKEASQVSGRTETTIRKNSRELEKILNLEKGKTKNNLNLEGYDYLF